MSSARLLRPLARSLQQRQSVIAQSAARPLAASFSTKRGAAPFTPSVSNQIQEYGQIRKDAKAHEAAQDSKFSNGSLTLMAGMPQLVPFYFLNEVTATYIAIPTLVYILSKYILPQTVRQRMARLFISKL